MSILALLTGRGNNTLQDKNVLDILGHPVLYYPAKAAAKSKKIDYFFCSSDDPKILNEAKKEGFQPIQRPFELAMPDSQHIDCIIHALKYVKMLNINPDIILVLLANNVTVKSKWIDDCIDIMQKDDSITAVVPCYEDNDHHPLRAKKINNDGSIKSYELNCSKNISTNRQDLPKCYFLAHNFWVLKVSNLLSNTIGDPPWGFMGNMVIPYIIEGSIDIHIKDDIFLAERWLNINMEE